ncbi:SDR family NAD(P)-dependent oxidoreductase [Parabacteroides sp. OttesenSCG-928-N08]|nr:SDR family NAD(P)-dependent oxidoreductase [Parabacteroides sp. OttesenSCG-928-N08]
MKRIVIIGATSGIGLEVARLYRANGWKVGVAGRRMERLEAFRRESSEEVAIQQLDVTQADATQQLHHLIDQLGGMDVFFLSSGVGNQNRQLDPAIEMRTVATNVEGFTRMVVAAYHYFAKQPTGGHIAVISSIAGTKGLGAAPSYSATKRFQNCYIDALSQLAHMQKLPITFTDIRPGFVDTDLLQKDKYPMLLKPDRVARQIVKAIDKRRRSIVIDWRYGVLVFFWRLIPEWLWERLSIHN